MLYLFFFAVLFWLLLRCLRSVGLHIMGGDARRNKKIAVSILRDCRLVIGSLADLRDTDTLLYNHVGPTPPSEHDPTVVVIAVRHQLKKIKKMGDL